MAWRRGQAYEQDLCDRVLSAEGTIDAVARRFAVSAGRAGAGGPDRTLTQLCAWVEREASGRHEFEQLCQKLGIEHRLTQPRTPRTNGMVERFNGRIADVLKTHRFSSSEDPEGTLLRYVALYKHQLPQSALKSKTPLKAMKNW